MIKEYLKKNINIDYSYLCLKNSLSKIKKKEYIELNRTGNFVRIENLGDSNRDCIIYLIDSSKSFSSGFFSNLDRILICCSYAHEHGMRAVVGKKTDSHYNEPGLFKGETDFFSYFFEQPDNIKDIDANKSHNVIKFDQRHIIDYIDLPADMYTNVVVDEIKRSLRFKKDVFIELENHKKKYLSEGKVLAVKYRGSDYAANYKNHPTMIPLEETVETVKREFEGSYDEIYLATEDNEALKTFKKTFGGYLKYDEQMQRADKGQSHITLAVSDISNHSAYNEGLNVLKDAWILANADSFVGVRCGVTQYAINFRKAFFNKEYENLIVLDKGINVSGKDSMKVGNKSVKE